MAPQSLVLCRDSQVLSVLEPVLAEMGIEASLCGDVSAAAALLLVRDFDAVIADCDDIPGAADLLQKARSASVKVELALAIVNGFDGMQQAFRVGANLVLWKPVTADEARRVLRTARGLVGQVRRRFSRAPVESLAYVRIETLPEDAMIISISEGGLGIQGLDSMQTGRPVHCRFSLPGSTVEIEADGEVAWADDAGRAGIRFTAITERGKELIRIWMSEQADDGSGSVSIAPADLPEELLPAPVVRSLGQRMLATTFDLLILGLATALFALVFYLQTASFPSQATALLAGDAIFSVLWLAYRLVFFRNPMRAPGARLVWLLRESARRASEPLTQAPL